jgi:hypothetical protein
MIDDLGGWEGGAMQVTRLVSVCAVLGPVGTPNSPHGLSLAFDPTRLAFLAARGFSMNYRLPTRNLARRTVEIQQWADFDNGGDVDRGHN